MTRDLRHPLLIVVALTAGSVVAAAARQAAFRTRTDAVIIHAAVTDGRKPVTTLTRDDFMLRDSGVPQTLLDFDRETMPLDVTLVIDVSGSMTPPRLRGVEHAVSQVVAAMKPEDRCAVLSFTTPIIELVPLRRPPVNLNLANRPAGGTAIRDALLLSLVNPPVLDRRQMVILMTDGDDTTSFFDMGTVIETAHYTSAQVSIVLAREGHDLKDGAMVVMLREVSRSTGGEILEIDRDGDLGKAFLAALENFRTSYVLRYVPAGVPASGWHEVDVKVKSKNYQIRARRGWAAPGG